MGIPTFMLAISIIAALGTGIKTMMLALCITSTPAFIRIVRAQVLTIRIRSMWRPPAPSARGTCAS